MSVETLIPTLGLVTLIAGLVFGVYRLIRVRAKQKRTGERG